MKASHNTRHIPAPVRVDASAGRANDASGSALVPSTVPDSGSYEARRIAARRRGLVRRTLSRPAAPAHQPKNGAVS
jgi:hypothetical protein